MTVSCIEVTDSLLYNTKQLHIIDGILLVVGTRRLLRRAFMVLNCLHSAPCMIFIIFYFNNRITIFFFFLILVTNGCNQFDGIYFISGPLMVPVPALLVFD